MHSSPGGYATLRGSRIGGIDVLRGISILSVLLLHTDMRIRFAQSWPGQHLSTQALNIICKNGHNGVLVFFVISGFLITTTSVKRWGGLPNIVVWHFYRIRFARIAPLLLALLAVLSVLHECGAANYAIDSHRSSLGRAVLSALTFRLNWLEAQRGYLPGSWDVLWSLSVEEMFYFFFPLVCFVLRGGRAFKLLLVVFVALGPLARTVFTQNEMWRDHSYLSCMDAIALGCLAAIANNRFCLSSTVLTTIRTTGVALMILMTVFRHQMAALGVYRLGIDVTILAGGTALLLIAIAQGSRGSGSRLLRPLRWFGANSYEVYLTHMFVVTAAMEWFAAAGRPAQWVVFWYGLVLLGSGWLGAGVARFYSEPLNRRLRPVQRESAAENQGWLAQAKSSST